jgi:hypothetical protein
VRRLLAVLLLTGCGSASGAPDGATADAASDGAVDARDAGPPCACAPFEACLESGCGCDGDPLCGTAGFATFRVVPPPDRELTARDGVVDDALTGLSWERAMDGAPLTHADARARCAELALDGHDDWRLPARVELATILDATRTPSLDDVFGAAVADYVWTASVAATGSDRAYAIYFGQGETILATASLAGGHVRCVRGERAAAESRRIEGGWLIDPGTGLEWSVALEGPSTLADARLACAERGGRVPTLYELHTLVAEGRSDPATDPALEDPSTTVWSTTERDFGEVLAWVMDFREGTSELRAVNEVVAGRCVRDGG